MSQAAGRIEPGDRTAPRKLRAEEYGSERDGRGPESNRRARGSESCRRSRRRARRQNKAKGSKLAANSGEPKKLPRKVFEKELRVLQTELCHLQEHLK